MVTGLAAVLVLFTALWLASLLLRNSRIVDMWWGPCILLIGFTYAITSNSEGDRDSVVLVLLMLGDPTGVAHRRPQHRPRRRLPLCEVAPRARRFVVVVQLFVLQAVIAWIISLPLYFAITSTTPIRFTAWDAAGTALFAIGFLFEAIGDKQLRRFEADPANKGRVLDTGLWRYTRHPNYFGEAVLWWGFGLFSVAAGGYLGLIGPAIMTYLLLRVSGVALLEQTLKISKPGYADYIANTPALFARGCGEGGWRGVKSRRRHSANRFDFKSASVSVDVRHTRWRGGSRRAVDASHHGRMRRAMKRRGVGVPQHHPARRRAWRDLAEVPRPIVEHQVMHRCVAVAEHHRVARVGASRVG